MTVIEFWSAVRELPSGTEVILASSGGRPTPVTQAVFKESCNMCEGRTVVFGHSKISTPVVSCSHCMGTGKKPHVVLS